jgi:hypothetical protein
MSSSFATVMYMNGRVVGYQYQLKITITYAEEVNKGEMVVFDSFGRRVDKFTREYHHGYHREHIKKSMRDTATLRDEQPELKEAS